MNVQIQSVKFDADKRLVEFVENKMDKLDRFAERSTGAEVILRLDKDFEKGNKIATVTLHMPGEDLVACHQSRSFEESVDEAIDAIKRQLKAAAASLAERGVAKKVCEEYLAKSESAAESRVASDALLKAITDDRSSEAEFIRSRPS